MIIYHCKSQRGEAILRCECRRFLALLGTGCAIS